MHFGLVGCPQLHICYTRENLLKEYKINSVCSSKLENRMRKHREKSREIKNTTYDDWHERNDQENNNKVSNESRTNMVLRVTRRLREREKERYCGRERGKGNVPDKIAATKNESWWWHILFVLFVCLTRVMKTIDDTALLARQMFVFVCFLLFDYSSGQLVNCVAVFTFSLKPHTTINVFYSMFA